MKKFTKFGTFLSLAAVLTAGLSSCNGDDINYDNVQPPTVSAQYSITVQVTDIKGAAIEGATVTMGNETLTTAADGFGTFENLAGGDYTLKAEAATKLAQEKSVTLDEQHNSGKVLFSLYSAESVATVSTETEETKTIVVPVVDDEGNPVIDEETGEPQTEEQDVEVNTASTSTETVEDNEQGEITVTADVPTTVTEEIEKVAPGATISITPIYSQEEGASMVSMVRADDGTEDVVLVGTNISCSDSSVTDFGGQTVNLTYNIDPSVATSVTSKKLVRGVWVDCPKHVSANGEVTIFADQFTSYVLLLGTTITMSTSSEALSFARDEWDNLYGSDKMNVGNATYTYKIGTEITATPKDSRSVLEAYLIEILARRAGATVTTATGTYPINTTLPVGTYMSIAGRQQFTTVSVSSIRMTVKGKQYGSVGVTVTTKNRQHIGSTN